MMENLIGCCIGCPNAWQDEDVCYNGEPSYECPKQQEWWFAKDKEDERLEFAKRRNNAHK